MCPPSGQNGGFYRTLTVYLTVPSAIMSREPGICMTRNSRPRLFIKKTYFIELFISTLFSAHPNLVVFVTHGGLLSTTEAVHFGVPIIGIPVFADQFMNVEKAVNRGFAQRVDLSYTMADELKNAILEVTSNKRCV